MENSLFLLSAVLAGNNRSFCKIQRNIEKNFHHVIFDLNGLFFLHEAGQHHRKAHLSARFRLRVAGQGAYSIERSSLRPNRSNPMSHVSQLFSAQTRQICWLDNLPRLKSSTLPKTAKGCNEIWSQREVFKYAVQN